jgi:hypothetical protein
MGPIAEGKGDIMEVAFDTIQQYSRMAPNRGAQTTQPKVLSAQRLKETRAGSGCNFSKPKLS